MASLDRCFQKVTAISCISLTKLSAAAVLNGPPHITVFLSFFFFVQVSKLPWIHILVKSPEMRIATGCHCNNHTME